MKHRLVVLMILLLSAPMLHAQQDEQRPRGREGRDGQRPDMEQRMQNLRHAMALRQLETVAGRLEPMTVSDKAELKLTEDQRQAVIRLEQVHAARLEEFKDTVAKVKDLLKEAKQLGQDEQNRAMVPEKIKRIQSLAEPITAANVEFAVQLAGVLTAEQLSAAGIDAMLMENFPWSQTMAARWLVTQEMPPEKKRAVVEAIRESDESLMVKLDGLLDDQQMAALREQLERGQRMAQMMARRGGRGGREGGGRDRGGRGGNRMQQAIEKLELDEKQQAQVREVFENARAEMQKLREVPQEQRREKFRELMQAQQQKLQEILTEEQQQKLREMMQQGGGARPGGRQRPKRENK